jgi:Zn-dependent M16 (insulinase) family peptidase
MYPSDFQLIRQSMLPALDTRALLFRHRSGLQVLSLENADRENLFALAFPTLPHDDTGVAHIIEHTVLCGSEKFPVKDPFIGMAKSSQATFINAMTYKNRTVYPIASCQWQDFFNLATVYWDAVFHPLLSKQAFQQEGWHYEFKGRTRELFCNGIVYNEMSGYYQSLDGTLDSMVYRHLFPGTPLACDTGGSPQDISKLTYEQFLDFYRQHYRPDQARVLCFGNIPTSDKLAFLSRNLNALPDHTPIPPPKPAPLPKTWKIPRTRNVPFVPTADKNSDNDGALALAWAIGNQHDLNLHLQMELLELLLFGHHGAPLQKAIMESGLCNAISSAGFVDECPQTMFLLAMRGCRPDNQDQLEKLILDSLEGICEQGLSQSMLQGAYRQMLLDYREIGKDFCLDIMETVFTAWFANADPVAFIYPEQELARLGQALTTEPDLVPHLIRRHLLQNPHRLRLNLFPDPDLLTRQEQQKKKELSAYRDSLSAQQLTELKRENKRLAHYQQQPDSPKAIATLPRLNTTDLPSEPHSLPLSEHIRPNGLPLLRGEVCSNGVAYLALAFDLSELPGHLRPCLPIFTALFPHLGCQGLTYDLLGAKMAENAAELTLELQASSNPRGEKHSCTLNFFLHGLEEHFSETLALLSQQLKGKTFQESKRLQELLKLFWSRILAELQDGGQHLASIRAAAGLSWKASLDEQWNGWQAACQWQKHKNNFRRFNNVQLPLLEELATWLGRQSPSLATFCGGDRAWNSSTMFLDQFGTCHPTGEYQPEPDTIATLWGRREFLSLPSDVFNCAQAFRAPGADDQRRAGLTIYAHLLSCGYLWNEIRMKAGAYGVQAQYLPQNATLLLRSSDDPSPRQTMNTFATLPQAGVEKNWQDDDIRAGIIACSKKYLLPWRPRELCQTALLQRLNAIDKNWHRNCYQKLLAQNARSVWEAVESFWQEFSTQSNCCLFGPARKARGLNMERIKF